MEEKKQLIRIIMMALVFILLFFARLFENQLDSIVITVMRLAAVVLGIICLGFYSKKLK